MASRMQHLSQTVLQFIVMTLLFQSGKTTKSGLERLFRLFRLYRCSDPVPIHFCCFIICVRIPLFRRAAVQVKRLFIALLHTLSAVIQTGKRILGILMVGCNRLREPFGCGFIILFRTKPRCIHFPDAIPKIGALLWLNALFRCMECRQCFCIPLL